MSSKRKQTRPIFLVCLGAAFLLAALAVLKGPSIVDWLTKATTTNPNNFADANADFFRYVALNNVKIYRFSSEENVQVVQDEFRIDIVSVERTLPGYPDRENRKAHANGAVLVFACHQMLHGNKELGRKLLGLLKKHDPAIKYNYPVESGATDGGYDNESISIDELIDAAEKMIEGDRSRDHLLEKPASQYQWRTGQYSPESDDHF